MTNILIKKIGTKFEVSNGDITITGGNRAQLLAIMDSLESSPASRAEAQDKPSETIVAEKVKKAGKAVREKIGKKTRKVRIINLLKRKTSGASASQIFEALAREGTTPGQWNLILNAMCDEKILKRKKIEGIWTYFLRG